MDPEELELVDPEELELVDPVLETGGVVTGGATGVVVGVVAGVVGSVETGTLAGAEAGVVNRETEAGTGSSGPIQSITLVIPTRPDLVTPEVSVFSNCL